MCVLFFHPHMPSTPTVKSKVKSDIDKVQALNSNLLNVHGPANKFQLQIFI